MVSWRVCGWCSGGSSRRPQHYRYEVVYRRDDSLYSGPDYLESLPGGRASLTPAAAHHPPLRPHHHHHHHHAHYQQRPPPPPHQYPPLDTFTRQNRVNHLLTALHHAHHPPQRRPHYAHRGPWVSSAHLGAPPPRPLGLPQWRSAPLLPSNYRDTSVSSRDHSRDTSRDISLASSSAHSTRPLLNPTAPRRPPPLITAPGKHSPCKPPHRSPRTPLSPGPPGYPETAFTFSPLPSLSVGCGQGTVERN
ncbi:developmental regulatory protein wetA-like [Portunus trituberculatus]|uniref:developmental regulatory protein wetA-like n=1 Tax=Portunus trituberculatus TaxID=210409 RepID=UPI001E1CF31F|nr:developmental regulatory protein wetA-like [Portunus trituberculatus]